MNKLDPLQQELVEAAGELAMRLSFARSIGQVFGLLYIHPDPLSLDDVADALAMSKGSVSVNLRTLEDWGAIRKVFVKGARRTFFSPERDLTALVLRRLQEGLRSRLSWARERLKDASARAGENGRGSGAHLGPRLKELSSFVERAERALDHLPKLRPLLKMAGLRGL